MNVHRWKNVFCSIAAIIVLIGCARGNNSRNNNSSQADTAAPSPTIAAAVTQSTNPPAPTTAVQPTDQPAPTPAPVVQPTLPPAPAPASANTPTPDPAAAQQQLIAAYTKLDSAYPYRITENSTLNGVEYDRVTGFAAEDKTHTTFNDGQEVIRIGHKIFVKSNNRWRIELVVPDALKTRVDLREEILAGLTGAQYIGSEVVNGLECNVYDFSISTSINGNSVNGTGRAWIAKVDGLPHQANLSGTLNNQVITTHLTYQYGVVVVIVAPIP